MNKVVLRCEKLSKTYQVGPVSVPVLKGIDFEVSRGELVSIMGSSGSGKTTFLNLLSGLDVPTSGQVFVDGHLMTKLPDQELCTIRNQHLGFVYQVFHLLPEFTALENVAMPLLIRGDSVSKAEASAKDMLSAVGLKDRFHHRPSELSGGQQQRVAIARAMVTQPSCVLADEPTGNLDRETGLVLFDMFLSLQREFKTAFVLVTHDQTLAGKTDKIYRLVDGALS